MIYHMVGFTVFRRFYSGVHGFYGGCFSGSRSFTGDFIVVSYGYWRTLLVLWMLEGLTSDFFDP